MNPEEPKRLALPGSVSPGMFQNPYAQMAALQGFPAPFQNPMVMPEDDGPPKWFAEFKSIYDSDRKRLEVLESQSSGARAARLAQVEEEEYESEEDDA